MIAPTERSVFPDSVVALQLCLGLWQIAKLTPVGALIQSCLMRWLLLPIGLSPAYARLKQFQGHVYKTVRCHETSASGVPTRSSTVSSAHRTKIESSYLNVPFVLERREENRLFLDGVMSYYITETIWLSLLQMEKAAPTTVFIKGYKEFWQQVATGGVMTLSEVLDSLILDNHIIRKLDNDLLLPVNLSVSEEKFLKFLNLVGLFLQTRQAFGLFPTLLSLMAAVLEFNTALRAWLYAKINLFFCCAMHLICDKLSRPARRQVYSLGNWVENLKPCNDIELKVIRGDICVVIGGGAKTHKGDATLVDDLSLREDQTSCSFNCDPEVGAKFNSSESKCHLWASTVALADVECTWPEFVRINTFLSCVAKHRSGSLKTCDPNNTVHVRGFRESVICYSKNGYPPVYQLHLEHAVVNGVVS